MINDLMTGLYMPCVGMMVGALLIRAFAVHVTLRDESNKEVMILLF